MGAWDSNINEAIRGSVSDEGSWETLPKTLMDLEGHTGLRLTLTTTPYRVLTSEKLTVIWDASSSVAAHLKVVLPRNLAMRPSKVAATLDIPFPRIRVFLSALSAGATDTPGFAVTAKAKALGGAVKATFTAVFRASQPIPGGGTSAATEGAAPTTGAVLCYDFFGVYGTGPVYLAPGDDMDITITPDAHTTDTLTIDGLLVEAAVNAAYTEDRLRV